MKKTILIFLLVLFGSLTIFGDDLKETPAFKSLNLYKIKIESELAGLKTKFSEDWPEVVAKKTELQVTKRELEKLLLAKQPPLDALGNSVGDLLIKRVRTETELLILLRNYHPTHPDIVAKKAELQVIVQEVETILPPFVQTTNEQKKEEPQKFQVKLFEIKYKQPETLANAITALGSGLPNTRIDPNNNLKTITVRDFPENIAAIEGAIKRLDLPDAAPVSIQTQIYLIAASDEAGDPGTFPKEIDPVLAQLKSTLKYKNYRFVNTFINRVNDGGSFESSGTGYNTAGSNTPTIIQCKMGQVRIASDNTGKEAIRIGKFSFSARVPMQVGQGSIQYQDVGITTELSLSEGGLVVVGTGNMGLTDGAMIVVVSAKKMK